ncbi:MAG: polysaccharide deacetylase family protein [Fimbriimonadales bacterium]|nr:polysaccharide deacetylase family protein [Fimbriimonadales bacterium]
MSRAYRLQESQEVFTPRAKERYLIIHADDFGMCHAKNRGTIRALEAGVVSSVSMMVPCPWFPEAAEWVRKNPNADVGLHLTLTSEWRFYRWRPVAHPDKVKGLIDKEGFLWRSVEEVVRHASPQEVETEIRAQIERAQQFGIRPTHLDSHMGTLYADPRFFEVFLKVAMEYKITPMVFSPTPEILLMAKARGLDYLPIYKRLQQVGIPTIDYLNPQYELGEAFDQHRQRLHQFLRSLKPGVTELIVHVGEDDPEGHAITGGWRYRVDELRILLEPAFKSLLQQEGIRLTTYRELPKIQGIQ